jgi:GntR family transcriptional regulator
MTANSFPDGFAANFVDSASATPQSQYGSTQTGCGMTPKNILNLLRKADWSSDGKSPKHVVLSTHLAEIIVSARCPPGTKLPTETEITNATALSLGTVQRALRTLVEDGMLERRRGHGTFVAERARAFGDPTQLRFLDHDGVSILPISLQVVSRRRTSEHWPWSTELGQSQADVLEFHRMIDVDARFRAFGRFFIRAGRIPFLDDRPLRVLDGIHFAEVVADAFPCDGIDIEQRLTVEMLPERICRLIDLEPGGIGAVLRIFARNRDALVYVQEIFLPRTPYPLKLGADRRR